MQDDKKPRHIQHALVQIGERVTRHDASVTRWYPEVVRLASYPVEEVRNTDAWVMGQDVSSKDASSAGFHEALLKMLNDLRSWCGAMRRYRWCVLATPREGRRSSPCCSRRRSLRSAGW